MNAAVSASVVLASRLTTDVSVFALMLFSIQSFVLFPMLRHRLQAKTSLLRSSFSYSLKVIVIPDSLVIRDDWLVYSSHLASRRPLADSYVVVCRYFGLYYLNRSGCPDMGTKI